MENNLTAHENSNNGSVELALAECWPGGPIVSNPAECKDMERDTWQNRSLPEGFPELSIGDAGELPMSKPVEIADADPSKCGQSDWRCLDAVIGGKIVS